MTVAGRVAIATAVLASGLFGAALVALFPMTIDNFDCGGRTGRVATVGSYASGNGEPTPGDEQQFSEGQCVQKARVRVAGGGVAGGAVGVLLIAVITRSRARA